MTTTPAQETYIMNVRIQARAVLNGIIELKAMQTQWNALDYGNTLPDGDGSNAGITADQVGAVVFATADAFETLLGNGHATNLASIL